MHAGSANTVEIYSILQACFDNCYFDKEENLRKRKKEKNERQNEKESRELKRNFRRCGRREFADPRDTFRNLRDVQFRSEAKDELTKNAAGLRLPAEIFSEFREPPVNFSNTREPSHASDRFRRKRKIDRT